MLLPRQILLPKSAERHTNDYLALNRVYLYHIARLETDRAYCGRNASGWDMPYRTQSDPRSSLAIPELRERDFCKQCLKVWSREKRKKENG